MKRTDLTVTIGNVTRYVWEDRGEQFIKIPKHGRDEGSDVFYWSALSLKSISDIGVELKFNTKVERPTSITIGNKTHSDFVGADCLGVKHEDGTKSLFTWEDLELAGFQPKFNYEETE